MASARPSFAVDESRTRPIGQITTGVKHDLSPWHIAPVVRVCSVPEKLEAIKRGESSSYIVKMCYLRMDAITNKLWFLEHKSVRRVIGVLSSWGCS